MSQYLQEAFKAFNLLEGEEFDLTDSGIEDMKIFMDDEDKIDFTDVIDPEAETEEEIKDSYIGKIILDCKVCHSKIYKNADEVHINDELDEVVANEGEECPFCYSVDGFEVVGQVAPFQETEVKVDVEPKEDEDSIEIETTGEKGMKAAEAAMDAFEEDEDIEESLKEGKCPKCGKKPCECEESLKEGLEDITKEQIVDWLSEHDQAFDDAKNHFKKSNLNTVDKDDILDWISEHDTLTSDFESFFKCKIDESLKEGLENLDIETEHDKIHVEAEEKEEVEEVIGPVEPAEEQTILNGGEEEESEEDAELFGSGNEEDVDIDFDEFDEDTFNTMGESYLKNVYENVDSFKASKVRVNNNDNTLIVEGVIKFKSGKQKSTSFKFESRNVDSKGQMKFIGENLQITRGKKSFTMKGSLNESMFTPSSFNYNYRVDGKRVYGTIKK